MTGTGTGTLLKRQDYSRISDYALLADCNGSALVNRDGSIDWLCLPRYDSGAIFARLLDPEAGHWSIQPADTYRVERRYLPGTLVLETTFTTATGKIQLLDALMFGEGQRVHDLGLNSPHELLRLVIGVEGIVDIVMELAPRPEYGLVRPLLRQTRSNECTTAGTSRITVGAGVSMRIEDATVRAAFRGSAGDRIGFALRWGSTDEPQPIACHPKRVATRIDDTVAGWRSWEKAHDIYHGPHRDRVRLSSRVLKGLAYRPTGAIVAAPTTSLPETVGGERNWDYRYAWIRDASLTLEALYIGACSHEAGHFVAFMTETVGAHVRADDPLQIMYGVGGEHDLSERNLPHLRGWRDSRPVRVGNDAWTQPQLDVYGQLLGALHLYREQLGELGPELQRFAIYLADAAAQRWTQPDAGMWEMRGAPAHHLSSKVLCWAALDSAVKLAPSLGDNARADVWATERDRIRDAIVTRGWSERRQAYAQSFGSDELDAGALLIPLVGLLTATDARMKSTIETIARDLTNDGLVLRYQNEAGSNADGLTGEEGTFVICSFWLVSCLALAGEIDRAEALFERLVGHANDLGLLAEEIDPETGDLLGNFPQAFSHIGLITAAWQLDQARARASGQPTNLIPQPESGQAAAADSWLARRWRTLRDTLAADW